MLSVQAISNTHFYSSQLQWGERARQLTPELRREAVKPVALIECREDPAAWQAVAVQAVAPASTAFGEWFRVKTLRFDFGRHLVGRLELELELSECNDAPVRVIAKFAETPYELATDFSSCHATLDHSWLQEDTKVFDSLPPVIRLERRYAFRYLELRLGSPNYDTRIKALRVTAESSAGSCLPAPDGLTEQEHAIDQTGVATLRDCMQSVFEDGPKRDRRLWLGDLWLQAKTNARTFRQFDLVERSLYLLCALADEQGEIPGSAFVRENRFCASCKVVTYALLLGPLLLDHLNFTGHDRCCRELLEVALRQQEIFRARIDGDGILHPKPQWWLCIDQDCGLKPATPALGIYLYSLRTTAELLAKLGLPGSSSLLAEAEALGAKVRRRAWDPARKLMVSDGPERQLSWATQAWLILAGVAQPQQARQMWQAAWTNPQVRHPKSPYLWGTVLEAGWQLGEYAKVRAFIREYWGGMIAHGADTFWEFYVPEDPFYSKYADPLMNSACHAWSCLPGYYLRDPLLQHPKGHAGLKSPSAQII